ncbi:MAG: MFS transporter [Candidatus Nanopelagicales bacterium]
MSRRPPGWLSLLALLLVATNLRPAIASISPVALDIRSDLGWSEVRVGMLTTLPVLCMGLAAPLVPRVARRLGLPVTMLGSLVLIGVALGLRLAGSVPGVLVVTALVAGIGIAGASGLLPWLVRDRFPGRIGAVGGAWTATMMGGAAVSGALTVPLAGVTGSWQAALASWGLLAVAAGIVWVPAGLRAESLAAPDAAPHAARPAPASASAPDDTDHRLPWRNPSAWALTGLLALNAFAFYGLLAWLAPSFGDRGWSATESGLLLGAFTIVQVGAALVLPALGQRLPERRWLLAALVTASVTTLVWIGLAPAAGTVVALLLLGLGLGGTFAIGLSLLSEYAVSGGASGRLTAMAFLVTYVVGALGPLTLGALLQSTGSWTAVYAAVAVACAGQLLCVPFLRRGIRIS